VPAACRGSAGSPAHHAAGEYDPHLALRSAQYAVKRYYRKENSLFYSTP
jgi:hypothetical protein